MTIFAKSLIKLLLLLIFPEHSGLEGRVPELLLFNVRLACALLIIGVVKFSGPRPGILMIEPHKCRLIIIVSAANHVKVASRSAHTSNFVQLASFALLCRHHVEARWCQWSCCCCPWS